MLPEGATAGQAEERPRLRKYIGAPVAAPSDEIQVTVARAEAVRLDRVPLPEQPPRGDPFAE